VTRRVLGGSSVPGASSEGAPLRLVLASNNAGKLAELTGLFGTLPLTLVTQGSLGIAEAAEPHCSFIENALAKARHAAAAADGPAIADDSGLCVDALGGAPGVGSAHFAELPPGHQADPLSSGREALRRLQDTANNRLLLERLAGQADRRARFVSTLVALRHAEDPEPLVAVGRWHGEVLHAPRGEGGFGYDPLLWIAELGCSVAELSAAQKNAHSHRALAVRTMVSLMQREWRLG
jgi:XTP/dITP diphosphohydrolase